MTRRVVVTALQRYPVLAAALFIAVGCRSERRLGIESVRLPSTAATPQSADAALAVDPGSGDLLLSWVGGDDHGWSLFLARSGDDGRTWSKPAVVAGGPDAPDEVHPHGESSPRLVAAPGGRVALAWPNSVRVEGRKWPAAMLRLARSEDGGATWSPPVTLNDDSTGAPVSHQFHGAAWQGNSGLVVAWLDERHAAAEDATIYSASSPDFGRSWTPNRRLWGAACPCCRVTLTRGHGGAITAAWRQHFPGSVRDVVVAPVSAETPEPLRVHDDEWSYPGCPHTGPAAAAENGAVHTAWYSGKPGASGVFYRRVGVAPGDSAGPLVPVFTAEHLPTAHVAVAPLADGGALVAYDVGPGGARVIRLARITAAGRRTAETTVAGSQGATYPQLALTSDGTAVLVYTVAAGDRRTLKAARAVVRPLTGR